ncbi:SPRY-domain-containing protein [Dichomitus squalens]|uniref:SPRY-domain-containing protein n=1 Tax=Dichomitus squalens TaxID=114155 RepID=A0A4Q9M4Q9_9APHY|nr:SPRY-domain-containing protein [Dichomitus squalens]TBU39278.1 SPRY-domain-containing protein [Dichomitus squalens]TBU51640.1 SPRY-domain-containing protein [Dichomitus squalens]
MSARQSRSASIPIPPSSVTRSLESVIPMSFSPSPAPRMARVPSGGTSVSFNLGRSVPPPMRSASTSYASATMTAVAVPRGRTSGPAQANSPPAFEPRIIGGATSPTPSRDPACNPPYSPSTSPARPRRLSSGIRTQSAVSTSPVAHRVPPPSNVGHPLIHSFPRPAYLDNSSLRDMLHTEPAPSVIANSSRPSSYAASSHDVRAGTSPPPATSYSYFRREVTPAGDSDDESIVATASPPPAVGAVTVLSTNTILMLPTRWSEQDRTPALSVSLDGRDLIFTGPSCMGDRESGAARANHAIPPACGIYYYEVEILHKCPKGPISIGFSAPDVRLSRLPGWEKNSWGYHADDGWAFPGHKDGSPYGPTFDTGDVIGCGIDFSVNRVFYTKNGGFLGTVFENVGKTTEIYPCIGMRQTNESIRANFGDSPFRFAIEEHVRAQRDAVWGNIMSTRVDWSLLGLGPRKTEEERKAEDVKAAAEKEKGVVEDEEESRAPLRKLVLAYLAHHGYARTARAFQRQCAERTAAMANKAPVQPKTELHDDEDVKMAVDDAPAVASNPVPSAAYDLDPDFRFDSELNTRLSITNAIVRGEIDTALSLISEHHVTVLEREQGLVLFRLRCRKFVELVLAAGEALRRVKEAERTVAGTPEPAPPASPAVDGEDVMGTMDGLGAMDVDDPSPEAHPESSMSVSGPIAAPTPSVLSAPTAMSSVPSPVATPVQDMHAALAAAARTSLHTALSYGQTLEADYKSDTRPGVRAHLRRTFGVVAYDDPIAAGGEVAEIAGQAARNALAAEVNQAILESQGRPAHPALETLFRQAGACVTQLGLLGVGSAAFADVRREFIEG